MTDKIQQARRAAFEEYEKMASKPDYEKRGEDLFKWNGATYVVTWVSLDYQLWCAALDFIVIDLTTYPNHEFSDRASAVDDCRAAIESTNLGIKVK